MKSARIGTIDVALAAALIAVGCADLAWRAPAPGQRAPDVLAYLLAAVSGGGLVLRRRQPFIGLITASVAVLASTAAGYRVGAIQYPVWLGLYFVLAARPPLQTRLSAIGVAAAPVVGYVLGHRGPLGIDVGAGALVVFVAAFVVAEITRSRRALAAVELERVALEGRARLARELHDALGHAVNVIVMQAGVARDVFETRPEYTRTALANIETIGRDALVELDHMLNVLGNQPMDDTRTPARLDTLDVLCDRIRAAGQPVELVVDDVHLSASGERAAYRIVQEAITNAARHSDHGPISVTVAHCGEEAVITVRNRYRSTARVRPGRGLANMTQRARLEGGDLQYATNGNQFELTATLPMTPAVPGRST